MKRIKIALVGLGKIARDQHMPALADGDAFELIGVASPNHKWNGLPNYDDLPALIRGLPEVSAVALCTPPQVRYDIARAALEHGLHVLLEKPPGVSVSEVAALADLAAFRPSPLHYEEYHGSRIPVVHMPEVLAQVPNPTPIPGAPVKSAGAGVPAFSLLACTGLRVLREQIHERGVRAQANNRRHTGDRRSDHYPSAA